MRRTSTDLGVTQAKVNPLIGCILGVAAALDLAQLHHRVTADRRLGPDFGPDGGPVGNCSLQAKYDPVVRAAFVAQELTGSDRKCSTFHYSRTHRGRRRCRNRPRHIPKTCCLNVPPGFP